MYIHIFTYSLHILLAYTCAYVFACTYIRTHVHMYIRTYVLVFTVYVGMGYGVLSPVCTCIRTYIRIQPVLVLTRESVYSIRNCIAGSLMVWDCTNAACPYSQKLLAVLWSLPPRYTKLCLCLKSCTTYSSMVLTPLCSIFIPSSSSCDHFDTSSELMCTYVSRTLHLHRHH